jgi:hypothetical protein
MPLATAYVGPVIHVEIFAQTPADVNVHLRHHADGENNVLVE